MLITVLLINQWITIGKKYFADHDAIRMVEREAALQRHIVADLIGVLLLQIDSKLVLKPKGERERKALTRTRRIRKRCHISKVHHRNRWMLKRASEWWVNYSISYKSMPRRRKSCRATTGRELASATAANASPRIGGSPRTSVSPKRTRYGKFLDMHCELVENTWLTFLFRNKLQQFG